MSLVWPLLDEFRGYCRRLPFAEGRVISLLRELAAAGDAIAAPYIAELVWAPRSLVAELMVPDDVRQAAASALLQLITGLTPEDWPDFDTKIRRWGWWQIPSQIAFGLYTNKVPAPADMAAGRATLPILRLLTTHSDGYVREGAVRQLAANLDGEELPALIWRLTDWVPEIRDLASQAIRQRLTLSYAPHFAGVVLLLQRVAAAQRTAHADLIADIETLLLTEPGQGSLLAGLHATQDKRQEAVCQIFNKQLGGPDWSVVDLVSVRPNRRVRSWALVWEERLRRTSSSRAANLRRLLSCDSAADIRLRALRAMVAVDVMEAMPTLRAALLDRGSGMRFAARYYLSQYGDLDDYAEFYRRKLTQSGGLSRRDLQGAIGGLADCGSAEDWLLLIPFLSDHGRIARSALRAMMKLNPDACRPQLFDSLIDSRDGLRKEAVRLVNQHLALFDAAPFETAWSLAASSAIRRDIINCGRKLQPWSALRVLLLAATDKDADLQSYTLEELQQWRPERRSHYLRPPSSKEDVDLLFTRLTALCGVMPESLCERLTLAIKGNGDQFPGRR